MKGLLFYLFQVIFCSGILYGYYFLALRNRKFHEYNRYYLLVSVFISIGLPFLNIPVYFTESEEGSSVILQTLSAISSGKDSETFITATTAVNLKSSLFTWENILKTSYLLAVILFLARFIMAIFRINKLLNKYIVERIDHIYFINTQEPGTPFSFFKWLFWNSKIDLKSEPGQQIFRHEVYHIEQKHSRDIVFLELVTIIFWINPFFHLIKREVKAIHEFLADRFAVKENNEWDYAELLLMQVLGTPHTRLTNPFFHNQIKRRIAMITSSKKPGYQYLRKLLVLPVAGIVIMLFAFTYSIKHQTSIKGISTTGVFKFFPPSDKNISPGLNSKVDTLKPDLNNQKLLLIIDGIEQKERLTIKEMEKKITLNNIHTVNVLKDKSAIEKYGEKGRNGVVEILTRPVKKDIMDEETLEQPLEPLEVKDNIVFEKTEIEPSFPGGEPAWRNFLENNLNPSAPADKGAKRGIYTAFAQFIVDKEGNVSDLKALTKHGYGMEEEMLRVIRLSGKWLPAIQNGHKVTAYRRIPITFVIENEVTEEKEIKDYSNPANWNYSDPAFLTWRRNAIDEVIAKARSEGKAAYEYKGRTYIFAKIDNPNPRINTFFEQDGINQTFLLNGKIVRSIDEINKFYKRNDIKHISMISKEEAKRKYNVDELMASIETF